MAVLLFALAGLAGCEDSSQPTETEPEPITVRTVPAEQRTIQVEQTVAGVVEPIRRAPVATRHSGTLEVLHVDEGSRVQEGEVLLEIDARGLTEALEAAQSQRESARSALEQARLNHERMQRLYAEELIARIRLEEAQLEEEQATGRMAEAEAQVRERETELDYARLRAPFDGYVSEVLIEAGGFVAAGQPVLILEDRSRLQVQASIGEREAARLAPGDQVEVVSPVLDSAAQARVGSLLPVPDDAGVGLRLQVLLDQPPPELEPGMVVELRVPAVTETLDLVYVPDSAIFRQGQLRGVFVVVETEEDLRARLQWVQLAEEAPDPEGEVAIAEGLRGGERVVVGEERSRLVDDQPVALGNEAR